ncbi:MAG TPA: hypothetical protein VEH09_12100, partial [Thermodesulfobacteriota bacterium]|nr:hypothetical protein [Thermodesulfobacteriota bacterium]
KATPGSVIDYLETNFRKVTEDPEFHATAKEIYHPVIFRERKAFFQNMTDGYKMYGRLIQELNLKEQQ